MMYRVRSPILLLLTLCGSGAALADPIRAQRPLRVSSPPPGGWDAFMPLPSTTSADLARRLAADPKLLSAYAKHFGVDAKRIPAFVKDALVLRPLSKAQTVVTYGRKQSGQIYPVRQVLPAGSQVWMTRDAKAWLKWKCTNPLGTTLPIVPIPAREGSGSVDFQLDISRPASVLSPIPESQTAVTVLSMPVPEDPPVLLDSPYKPAPYRILPLGLAPIPERSSKKNLSPWLWAIGVTLPRGHRTTNAIPEPSTLALVVFGGAAVLPMILRRTRKK
jgi:hypothetical protein